MVEPAIPKECFANLSNFTFFTSCIRALCRQENKELTDAGKNMLRKRFSDEFQKSLTSPLAIDWLILAKQLARTPGVCGPPRTCSRVPQKEKAKSPSLNCYSKKILMKDISAEESLGLSIVTGALILTIQALKSGVKSSPIFGLFMSLPLIILEEEASASKKSEIKEEWVPPRKRNFWDWLKYIWDYTFGIPSCY